MSLAPEKDGRSYLACCFEKAGAAGVNTALHIALSEPEKLTCDMARQFLNRGASVMSEGEAGQTILAKAVIHKRLDLVKIFLDDTKNHFINAPQTESEDTLLMLAVKHGASGICNELLNRGALVNQKNRYLDTALTSAIHSGSSVLVETLIKAGADIQKYEQQTKSSLLHKALRENRDVAGDERNRMVGLLVDHGAGLSMVHEDMTPVQLATGARLWSLVDKMVMAGAVCDVGSSVMASPVFMATQAKQYDLMKKMIKAGASADGAQEDPQYLLEMVIQDDRTDVLSFLVEHGARVNVGSKDGKSSFLGLATVMNDSTALDCLIKAGADINQPNARGETPLMSAVKADALRSVMYLLEHGADKEVVNAGGETALHFAGWFNRPAAAKMLIDYGANQNACNAKGETPRQQSLRVWGEGNEIAKVLAGDNIEPVVQKRQPPPPLDYLY